MSTPADRLHNFGFVIKDIGRLYTRLFEYEAEHLGITLAEAKVLTYLSRNPALSQVQLSELTGVEPMSLVRILDRMEADQRIERRAHPTDRRARQLHLRAKGEATLDQIWKLSAQVRSQSLTGFKVEERNQLITLLERVHEQLLQMTEQMDKAATRSQPLDTAEQVSGRKQAAGKAKSVAKGKLLAASGRSKVGKSQRAVR
jgi:MarR family transcriptional regulator, transcriptional regulator for hemolysin